MWGYCHELLQAGYPAVVQLRMTGRLADQLLQALVVQDALLMFADMLLNHLDDPLCYHNMRMPLRLVAFTPGEQRATLVCLHPEPDLITLRYLADHATPSALCTQAAAIWPDIVQAAYHTLREDAGSR